MQKKERKRVAEKNEKQPQTKKRSKTAGQLAVEHHKKRKESLEQFDIESQSETILRSYMDELQDCAEDNFKNYESPFYIAVLTKQEELLKNIIRNYFVARQSCPTPTFDQSVFKVNKDAGTIEYLWTVPNKKAAEFLWQNAQKIKAEQHQLLQFVMDFKSGELDKIAMKLNNEI
jgi:hypothetical protein